MPRGRKPSYSWPPKRPSMPSPSPTARASFLTPNTLHHFWKYSKDLLGHLAHWEQGAAEQVRELQAGTWSPRKRTLEEVEQINREVTAANHATLVSQLRDQFSRART